MPSPLALLELLADARFHSGSELARSLGIAPTTVWKQVRALEDMGIEIYAVRGRGYRLAQPLERLDASAIRARLATEPCTVPPAVHVLEQVDSTSEWLAQRAEHTPDGTVCLAEQQLAGRGRRGRTWASPFGRNVYLSILWRIPTRRVSGLSIAMGVAVAEACESLGAAPIGLKWPNDVVGPAGKVGGVLVDLSSRSPETSTAIVGIGLNVDMPARLRAAIGQPVSDLNELARARLSRNALAAAIVDRVRAALSLFVREGLAPFRPRFERRDASRDQQVSVEEGGRVSVGRARGIDEHGALMLETAEGIARIQSGDVSLRAVT